MGSIALETRLEQLEARYTAMEGITLDLLVEAFKRLPAGEEYLRTNLRTLAARHVPGPQAKQPLRSILAADLLGQLELRLSE